MRIVLEWTVGLTIEITLHFADVLWTGVDTSKKETVYAVVIFKCIAVGIEFSSAKQVSVLGIPVASQ